MMNSQANRSTKQLENEAWELFKHALEIANKQRMDAEEADFKEADSDCVLVIGDPLKLTIKLCKPDGKLVCEYNTSTSEIGIEKRDGDFVFTDSGTSGNALQTADRLLGKLAEACRIARAAEAVSRGSERLTTELNYEKAEAHKLSREDQKAYRERKIFSSFVKAAMLQVAGESIRSELPPIPDVSCLILGKRHYFELVEITDPNLAARVATSLKGTRITAGSFSQDRPLKKAFADKAQKKYPVLDGPLELLVYYQRQYSPLEGSLKESTLRDLEITVRDMLAGQWARLWIFDMWRGVILHKWE